MSEELKQYLCQFRSTDPKWMQDLQEQAKNQRVPIMEKDSLTFMLHLLRIHKPKRILEIGTAIGYSALCMADTCPQAEIVTIEKDSQRYKEAVLNIQKLSMSDKIEIVYGDAREVLPGLSDTAPFDFVFIDAAKGQYQNYFGQAVRLLTQTGVIVSDNVLFRGFVYGKVDIPTRYQSMVTKIRHYNEWLMQHPDFHTTIVPLGDGLAISSKKK
ncbi:Caffeoyl-CoA O-methyltransferase [Lentibacillus sp. JNUCC-1]|uniref:O-methyltransferase n=1 Tax=Lentibacillus sp. JNUCC-1 TaxID=2654513 RepID=UPI0012E87B74|nr:O-methyltransferase [Lentibacillus sp. JNUCC-1]MUV39549.1 Caffeoyl-CoA O-methyltransferase [Lentibacillus sp. JNUCC-1]